MPVRKQGIASRLGKGSRTKTKLPITLCCVDTTNKAHLAERAILKSLEQADFAEVKLLTNNPRLKYAVQIPEVKGLEGYSNFVCRELHKHVNQPHALIVQADGYVLNGKSWTPRFLDPDYIGAPWHQSRRVGNGGFSLRSKKLLEATARLAPSESTHPEDSWICARQRANLEAAGLRIAEVPLASAFALEGRVYDGRAWNGAPLSVSHEFGFHSWLTILPEGADRPIIGHHSGDAGDVIYSLPVLKALGGGVLFLSGDNRYPYPRPTRWAQAGAPPEWVGNLSGLLNQQDYIWGVHWTQKTPFSCDVDLNAFRQFYKTKEHAFDSIFSLHQLAVGVTHPETEPWLTVDRKVEIEGRDIVVARSERFHNDLFPWRYLTQKYGHRMAFVGTWQEASLFQHQFGAMNVIWHKTETLLDVARVIAGAKCFIGNQSSPLAISLGLGQNSICEVWLANANCKLRRENAIHVLGNTTDIPPHWLE